VCPGIVARMAAIHLGGRIGNLPRDSYGIRLMSEYLQPSLERGGLAVVSFLWFLFLFILECLLYFFPWVFFLLFCLSW
jgi:hypothetical protein